MLHSLFPTSTLTKIPYEENGRHVMKDKNLINESKLDTGKSSLWKKISGDCQRIKYCLSNDAAKPCIVVSFKELFIMLDCGLSAHSTLSFLPLPLVPSTRLSSLQSYMPPHVNDPLLEGELKECCGRVFVDSTPEFSPPLDKIVDLSQLDIILISNYTCMLALPFITEGTGFKGIVYATEPTLQIGRFYLEELVEFMEQAPRAVWARRWKEVLHLLPAPLADVLKPRSWRRLYDRQTLESALARVRILGYDQKVDIYGAVEVTAVSSGFCLGSSNWVLNSGHEKIAYVSGSSTLTTHPRPINQSALKGADLLIMTGLTQTPAHNPDNMLGDLCMHAAMTVRSGGSVLIPCYPSGVVYDLLECLSGHLDNSGLSQVPMFFISPAADSSLAYSNILAEWLSTAKQSKVYLPEEPFPHALLIRTGRLKHYKHIHSDGFSTDFRQPCVVFCGHPSLRFGDTVHFIEMWGSNPLHAVIFTEPDFPYMEALAPFQPLAMKAFHCPIDTSLNFSQANKLIKDLRPQALIVPEQYTIPAVNAPPKSVLTIEDRPVLVFRRGGVIRLPVTRRATRGELAPELISALKPQELRPGLHVSGLAAALTLRDNRCLLTAVPTALVNSVDTNTIRYEWSSLDIDDFVRELAREGITDAKVETGADGCIIHLQHEDTLIQVDSKSTHIFCEGEPSLRLKLRSILLKCLPTF